MLCFKPEIISINFKVTEYKVMVMFEQYNMTHNAHGLAICNNWEYNTYYILVN